MHHFWPVAVVALLAGACASEAVTPSVAYVGATVWQGTDVDPVAGATLVVRDGRVVDVLRDGGVPDGASVVDLSGRYVTPGWVDAHAHVNGLWAPVDRSGELERVRGGLELFAAYGVTTVNSLGDGSAVLEARNSAAPSDPRARVLTAGPVIAETDPAQARSAALGNVAAGVDWLKLRVDDNLGTAEKMPWGAVQAVMAVGAASEVPVATHVFYLDDARRVLELGSSMIAHSVRDTDVDAEFLEQLRASGACYVPTLTREVSTFVYADRPDFFDDPFFTRLASAEQVARASDPDFMREMAESPAAAGYRRALEVAQRNLVTVHASGVPVAMGTDAGPAARFPGYFEHLELWMMVDAGLTPKEALRSATEVAARCAGVPDRGTLHPGQWADFVVFAEDPLADIRATRSLEEVYIGGSAYRSR